MTIHAVTEMGQMMDFIKAFPSVTPYAYMWEWTVPQIRLASADNTRVIYLSDKQLEYKNAKHFSGNNIEALSDLGIPIFK